MAAVARRGRALSLCAGLKSTSRMATAMPASPLRFQSVCPVSMHDTYPMHGMYCGMKTMQLHAANPQRGRSCPRQVK